MCAIAGSFALRELPGRLQGRADVILRAMSRPGRVHFVPAGADSDAALARAAGERASRGSRGVDPGDPLRVSLRASGARA